MHKAAKRYPAHRTAALGEDEEVAGTKTTGCRRITGRGDVASAGDFNDDGLVDAADYVVWRDTQSETVARGIAADGNGDGTVSLDDYAVWTANFGRSYVATGSSLARAVPEPGTIELFLFLAFIKPRLTRHIYVKRALSSRS